MRVRSVSARNSLSVHGRTESIAQDFDRLCRHARGCEVRTAEDLLADDQFDRLLVAFALDEFPDLRDTECGQLGLRLKIDLGKNVGGLVADPVRTLRFQTCPVETAH